MILHETSCFSLCKCQVCFYIRFSSSSYYRKCAGFILSIRLYVKALRDRICALFLMTKIMVGKCKCLEMTFSFSLFNQTRSNGR